MDEQSKEMSQQEIMMRKKDAKIKELESMLKANDTNQNMDYTHLLDEINSKDTIIADLKYKFESVSKGNKETDLEILILKRSNGELNEGL